MPECYRALLAGRRMRGGVRTIGLADEDRAREGRMREGERAEGEWRGGRGGGMELVRRREAEAAEAAEPLVAP